MNMITVLGYVYSPVTTKSTEERSYNVFKIRYQQNKSNYQFVDVFVSDGQAKYLANIEKGNMVLVSGEMVVNGYINKEGQAAVKATISAKSLKIINPPLQEKKETNEAVEWF